MSFAKIKISCLHPGHFEEEITVNYVSCNDGEIICSTNLGCDNFNVGDQKCLLCARRISEYVSKIRSVEEIRDIR